MMKGSWDAILWWEKRRIAFNLVVLVAGILSILIVELIGSRLAKAGEDVVEPIAILMGVIVYAVAANLCYSLGWITELLWSGGNTSRTAELRPKVFRLGMILSIVLTLLPAVVLPLVWAIWGFD